MKKIQLFITTLAILTSTFSQAQNTGSTPPKDGSWYKIQVVQTGKYLTVSNAGTENGTPIVQWDYEGKKNQKFQVKKHSDGTYSFFAGHTNKSICADKGDNREGDLIIQNTLSEYFGKWYLSKLTNCGSGWKIQYKSASGKPLQVTGVNNGDNCKLIQPIYQDAAEDCPYNYVFEPVDSPLPVIEKIKSHVPVKKTTIKKGGQ